MYITNKIFVLKFFLSIFENIVIQFMKVTKLTKVNIVVNHLPMHWPPVLAWQKICMYKCWQFYQQKCQHLYMYQICTSVGKCWQCWQVLAILPTGYQVHTIVHNHCVRYVGRTSVSKLLYIPLHFLSYDYNHAQVFSQIPMY